MRICCHTAGKGGVAFYRMLQPYKWVGENTDAEVFIYDPSVHSPQRLRDEQEAADIWVYQMTFGEFIKDIIIANSKRAKPKKIVLEYDDYIFSVHPMNDAYKTFGTQEVNFNIRDKHTAEVIDKQLSAVGDKRPRGWKDGAYSVEMWKDGKDGFNLEANIARSEGARFAIQHADLVTVTNSQLGKQFRKLRPTGAIAVLPNLLDFNRWLPAKKNDTNELRIFWAGGSAHYADLHLIRKPLWQILDKYPNVKLVLKGVNFTSLFKPCPENGNKDYSSRVEWVAWHSDINTYPLDIRDCKADIGLCPVIDDAFNRGKSELKWLEYSALKIPAIMSPVCYTSAQHGKTGFYARTPDEWFEYIEKLILSPELRTEIAEKAYTRVKNFHGIDKSYAWYQCLKDLNSEILKPKLSTTRELVTA